MLLHSLIAAAGGAPNIFGAVSPPPGVTAYDNRVGGQIGIVVFFSALIQIATLVAGIYVFFQFILAGYDYVTANGDSGAHNRVKDRLTMSVLGLVIIVASYSIAGLIGLIFFGDATYILVPKLGGILQ